MLSSEVKISEVANYVHLLLSVIIHISRVLICMKINVGTFLEAEDQCAFPSVQSEGTGKKKAF